MSSTPVSPPLPAPDALRFAAHSETARPLTLVTADTLSDRPEAEHRWADALDFRAQPGRVLPLPDASGALVGALAARPKTRLALGGLRGALPPGDWTLTAPVSDTDLFSWLAAGYRFDRYKAADAPKAQLTAPDGADIARLEILAGAEALIRDLINTPANDMGPDDLEAAARALAEAQGARIEVTTGDALLDQNLPLIHTVGRAGPQAPRLIDLRWGDTGPKLTLVGKGVCFDTGGLNLKPGGSMGLMKKDMGGSAHVLGLARAIMALGIKVQLRVLIPAVENSVASDAYRPGDVLRARNGLTIENTNTDAEGRLVLADALALGAEESPDLMVSMATLTGAARVALGPEVVPFYTDDDALAVALAEASRTQEDPLWRMPFVETYDAALEPLIADLDNAPMKGMAGSVTAALFLRRFVAQTRYVHFDLYGWQPKPAPGRPVGAIGQAWRALLACLPAQVAS